MSLSIQKITLLLELSDRLNLPIGPNLIVSSAVPVPLSPNEVFREIISNLASILCGDTIDTFATYDRLRQQLNCYREKHQDLDEQLTRSGELLVGFLFLKSFPKHNGTIVPPKDTVYLTKDLQLSVSEDMKMSTLQYIEAVFSYVKRYLAFPIRQNGPIVKKEFIDAFKSTIQEYIKESPLSGQDRRRARLIYRDLLWLVRARSQFENGLQKFDKEIAPLHEPTVREQLQKLRSSDSNLLKDDDISMITDMRDRLFVEEKLLHHLLKLIKATHDLATNVSKYGSDPDLRLKEEIADQDADREAYPIIVYARDSKDLLTLGMELGVHRGCRKIARGGALTSINPLFSRLVAYKRDNDCENVEKTNQYYERFVATLEMNELSAVQKQCIKKWSKIKFCTEALVDNVDIACEKDGYLQKRRHAMLLELGHLIHGEIHNTVNRDQDSPEYCKVKQRFQRQQEVASLCLNVLETLYQSHFSENDEYLYKEISEVLDRVLRKRKAKALDYELYKQIWYHTEDCKRSDPEYEEYGWKNVDYSAFIKLREENRALWRGELSAVRRTLADFETPLDGHLDDTSQFTSVVSKKVNRASHKAITPKTKGKLKGSERRSRSLQDRPSENVKDVIRRQPEKTDDAINAATEAFGALTLSNTSAKIRHLEQKKKPVFQYHERVLRWFHPVGSSCDPYLVDPSYRLETNESKILWGRVKHSFGYAVDSFVSYGVEDQDKKELDKLRLQKRIQIIGEIALNLGHRNDVRQGVFGYSVSRQGKCIHRCFSRVESERIQSEYMNNGWVKLNERGLINDVVLNVDNISKIPLDDGSRVVRETANLVVISDPKNNATITLVKMS